MNELVDMNTLFDLSQAPGEISAVERLLNEFEAHEGKEEGCLQEYRTALAEVKNPITRLVLQLIISDEEKHRAVVHAMGATLKGSLTWTKPQSSLEGSADLTETNQRLLKLTETFVALEKEGIKEYKTLLKDATGYYHGLFKILLNAMIRDSEKHIELLEFLRERLKAA
jgi:rubrerythrin